MPEPPAWVGTNDEKDLIDEWVDNALYVELTDEVWVGCAT